MNWPFMKAMIRSGCLIIGGALLYGWWFTDLVDFFPIASGAAVTFAAGMYIAYGYVMRRQVIVLNILPVSQRSVARGFWLISIVLVPLCHVLLLTRGAHSLIAHVELLIAALGMASAWSLWLGLARAGNFKNVSWLHSAGILTLLVVAFGLSTDYVPRIADDPLEGNIILASSTVLFSLSYRYVEHTWGPRIYLQNVRDVRQDARRHNELKSLSTPNVPAGYVSVYGRPVAWGAGAATSFTILFSAFAAWDDGLSLSETGAEIAFILPVACLMTLATAPGWQPNMRSLRLLPLSRVQQTLFVLGHFALAYLWAPAACLLGCAILHWDTAASLALVCAGFGAFLLGAVAVVRFGLSARVMFFALVAIVLLSFFVTRSSVFGLLCYGLVTLILAFAWLYYMIGSSDSVYHRSNPLNAFSPEEM